MWLYNERIVLQVQHRTAIFGAGVA